MKSLKSDRNCRLKPCRNSYTSSNCRVVTQCRNTRETFSNPPLRSWYFCLHLPFSDSESFSTFLECITFILNNTTGRRWIVATFLVWLEIMAFKICKFIAMVLLQYNIKNRLVLHSNLKSYETSRGMVITWLILQCFVFLKKAHFLRGKGKCPTLLHGYTTVTVICGCGGNRRSRKRIVWFFWQLWNEV